jgi:hypothetical protein
MDSDKRTCSITNFTKNIFSSESVDLDEVARENILALQAEAISKTKFAVNWRNKRIAHLDMDITGVEEYDVEQIKEGIDAIHQLINLVQLTFFQTQMLNQVVGAAGSASALLYNLRDGLEYRQDKLERASLGQPGSADFRPKPLPTD